MNVSLVTHRYPPNTGGVETHVRELAVELVNRGHDVTVWSADAGTGVPTRTTEDGIEVRRSRSASPGDAFYVAPGLVRAVRSADIDVVHAHNIHALPLLFAALAVREERFIVTPHYHGASASGFRDVLFRAYRPLARRALQRADAVVAVSNWEGDVLNDDFGVEATVVPNGVRVERYATATPERRDRPYLLCVGRLEEYKGVQYALRAMPELPEYDLLIAGEGPFRSKLESVTAQLGVDDQVTFLGYVEESRLPSLFAGCAVHLALSSFEAYGMTVAEALAAGTPCVVRESGALVDWTSRPAVRGVESPVPERICEAVGSLVGQSVCEPIPDWSTVVTELEALYTASSIPTTPSRPGTTDSDAIDACQTR